MDGSLAPPSQKTPDLLGLEPTDDPSWQMLAQPPRVDIRANLTAATQAGAPLPQLLLQAFRLARGPGRLSLHEYLYYKLWSPEIEAQEAARFIGRSRQNAMHMACLDPRYNAIADDKILFHQVMSSLDLPTPRIFAIVDHSRSLPGIESLRTKSAIESWLRTHRTTPIFMKPTFGVFSLGTMTASGYDALTDTLITLNHNPVAVPFAAERMTREPTGYIIQERLTPPRETYAIAGNRLCSVRLVVLLTPNGPELTTATIKIPGPDNIADNYWRTGNTAGAVDLSGGTISRAATGTAKDLTIYAGTSPASKNTPFVGQTLPYWERTKSLVLKAAANLPGCHTQAWDVALTKRGPVLLEVNRGGDFNLSQIASGRGALTDRYAAHLAEHNFRI